MNTNSSRDAATKPTIRTYYKPNGPAIIPRGFERRCARSFLNGRDSSSRENYYRKPARVEKFDSWQMKLLAKYLTRRRPGIILKISRDVVRLFFFLLVYIRKEWNESDNIPVAIQQTQFLSDGEQKKKPTVVSFSRVGRYPSLFSKHTHNKKNSLYGMYYSKVNIVTEAIIFHV